MSIYRRGTVYWYEFVFGGERIRESSKQSNKRTAEQIQAAHKTRLAKAEVGLKDPTQAPTLRAFAELRFLPFVRQQFEAKPRTIDYYQQGVKRLLTNPQLADARLDAITPEHLAAHAAERREAGLAISSVNRQLEVLRRIFTLAMEWRAVDSLLPKVRLMPGETQRERVLSAEEERCYMEATEGVGVEIIAAHDRALTGIRAVQRGQTPIPPRDPYILRDIAVLLLDCGLRPDECFRLRRENVQENGDVLMVHSGKTASARRRIPLPARAKRIIDARIKAIDSEWLFPALTRSGRAEPSTIRDHHAKALKLAKLESFVLYTLRHTCLTKWAAHMDPYTLAYLAGHSCFSTTKRYVHPQKETILAAMVRATKAPPTTRFHHTPKIVRMVKSS